MVAKDIGEMGLRLITPASITLIVFAIALVAYSPDYNFTDTWILIGITGYVITPFLNGVAEAPKTFNSTATKENVTGLTKGSRLPAGA